MIQSTYKYTKKRRQYQYQPAYPIATESGHPSTFQFLPTASLNSLTKKIARGGVFNTATAKLAQISPVYVAWFTWQPNLFNGRMRAFHCLDICFWLNNTDLMWSHTGGSKEARTLSNKMAESLAAFMRTGNPDTGRRKGLPKWGPFTSENGETMVLDNNPTFGNAPDAAARSLMKE